MPHFIKEKNKRRHKMIRHGMIGQGMARYEMTKHEKTIIKTTHIIMIRVYFSQYFHKLKAIKY